MASLAGNKRIKLAEFDVCFEPSGKKDSAGRTLMRCKCCWRFSAIVGRSPLIYKKKIPALCNSDGCVPRKDDLQSHLDAHYLQECIKADALSVLNGNELMAASRLGLMISAANKGVSQTVAGHMISVFNDAQRGRLSAFSWPSRVVAQNIAEKLKLEDPHNTYEPTSDLMYVNPNNHSMFLDCIVRADLPRIKQLLVHALTVFIRVDGSVDKYQIDNKFVMLKVVTADGFDYLLFLGFAEPEERKAAGYFEAVKKAGEWIIHWDTLFGMISSICTDGESLNTGEKSSLWALLDLARKNTVASCVPLTKVWCAAHRSNLAYVNLHDTVDEVKYIATTATGIATYFRTSEVRVKELRKLAADRSFAHYLAFPATFTVRFTQFNLELLDAVLGNFRLFVTYLTETTFEDMKDDGRRKGHLADWTCQGFLQNCCVLRDVLLVFSRFQKKMQSNELLLTDVSEAVQNVRQRLQEILDSPMGLLGGWESRFLEEITEDVETGVIKLQGIELQDKIRRSGRHNLFVSEPRNSAAAVSAVRTEIITTLINFVQERMAPEDKLCKTLASLQTISQNATNEKLKAVHKLLIPELSLEEFGQSYRELGQMHPGVGARAALKISAKMFQWKPLTMALARSVACTPHSCDVERLISAYNLLKSPLRSSLGPETIRNFLYVQLSMPVLAEFNVRPAIKLWLEEKDRRPRVSAPLKSQQHFAGVFAEASD